MRKLIRYVCKYRDYLLLRECAGKNARLTLRPQPKRRCRVMRAPQARAKKLLRILYIIQFLYFTFVLQSHNKYFNHDDTLQSLKKLEIIHVEYNFYPHTAFRNGQCVFANAVRVHANKTNVQTLNNSKVYVKRRYCIKRTGSRTLVSGASPARKKAK